MRKEGILLSPVDPSRKIQGRRSRSKIYVVIGFPEADHQDGKKEKNVGEDLGAVAASLDFAGRVHGAQ